MFCFSYKYEPVLCARMAPVLGKYFLHRLWSEKFEIFCLKRLSFQSQGRQGDLSSKRIPVQRTSSQTTNNHGSAVSSTVLWLRAYLGFEIRRRGNHRPPTQLAAEHVSTDGNHGSTMTCYLMRWYGLNAVARAKASVCFLDHSRLSQVLHVT